jgi:hypothetical protein
MKIDKNVPMPSRISSRIRIGHLPLGDLESGDSIFIPCTDEEKDRILHAVRVRLNRFARANMGYKFSATKVDKGVRIWRK